MNARAPLLTAALLLLAPEAHADDATRRAREELERQLQQLVQTPAPRVRVAFEPLDEPNMKLESAEFMLDGRMLPAPSADALMKPGVHTIHAAEVPEGRHELIVRLAYVDASSMLLSAQAGFRWKVSRTVRFETQDGLEVTVRATPERVSGETDPRKQMTVTFAQDVKMLAKVDTTLPPAPAKVASASDATDAGVAAAAAAPAPLKPESENAVAAPAKAQAAAARQTVAPAVARGTSAKQATRRTSVEGSTKPAANAVAARHATGDDRRTPAEPPLDVVSLTAPPEDEAEAEVADASPAAETAKPVEAEAAAVPPVQPASFLDRLPLVAGGAVALLLGVIVVARRRR